MILFLHNRYRTPGGEERVVDDLLWLVREQLGEEAELLDRDSGTLGRSRAGLGVLRGGLAPEEVGRAVRRTRARIVHAHNLHPSLGWRALAAAREAGARVVLHLHNYRMVCAIGVCFTEGADCVRCHGRHTLPGVRHNCRGSASEAVVYAAGLALWQRRLAAQADLFVVPSAFAARRLHELGAPVDSERVVVAPHVVRDFASRSSADGGRHALVASRLAPEKGIDVALDACRSAGVPLVIAGDGPERDALVRRAAGGDVRFAGAVGREELAGLRQEAALALVPSRAAETFALAAAEAMAAGVPVLASRVGALPELLGPAELVPAGDPAALAAAIPGRYGDAGAGQQAIALARERCGPQAVGPVLARAYASAEAIRPA